MDIKDTEEKLKQVDSLLTTLTKLLKRHWIILTLILISFGIYCVWNYEDEEENVTTEQVDE